MKFGYFDDLQREYVITQPDTPLPWLNYLGSEEFFGLISNTTGGYCFYRDARLRRVTRYRYNNVPFDTGGRYIYLRDDASGDFWSPSWQPVRRPLDDYTCRHGMGYTAIDSRAFGIEARTLYFVPQGETLEVWRLEVTNHRSQAAELSVFSAVEWCLWDAWDDMTNFQRNFNTAEVEVESDARGGVIYHKTEYRERRDHFAYFACSIKPRTDGPGYRLDGSQASTAAPSADQDRQSYLAGFDTQRESFLGAYRGWDNPLVVEQGRSTGSMAHGWSPIGSHHVKLALQPGETRQVIFLLGYQENPRDRKFDPPASTIVDKARVKPIIARYLQPDVVDAAFAVLRERWSGLLGLYQVETPDEHTNRMVNIWNAYQVMVTFNLSRSTSFYESGVGRGMGFRDSNQDLLGFVHMIPARARERILDLAATQFENGGAYHQYQPLTKRGNDAVGSGFNDDPLWLILSVAAYLKETGDRSILEEPVVYENRPGTEAPLFDHLQRSLQHTLDRLGPHGLPLIGRADWNDCLNLNCFSETPGESFQTTTSKDGKVAESVFIAGQFVLAAKEMAGIAAWLADGGERIAASEIETTDSAIHRSSLIVPPSSHYLDLAAQMDATVREHGWDGAWFVRAYDDYGQKVGSQECQEGQIFIEPQGMCVMAGIGLDDGLAEQALASVGQRLATQHGVVLLQPAFTHYYLNLGEISTYPPGYKENASVFCHTNPWIMIAEARLGHGDRALDYYHRICPSAREAIGEIHRCEPYVYAQTIAGRDAATFGEAKNSWLTGTAAWNYVAITQWILGIRPTFDGLRIAPVVPDDWPGFKATRVFRGVTYDIDVRRAGPGNAVALTVDGQAVDGDVVPLPPAGQNKVNVGVVLGG